MHVTSNLECFYLLTTKHSKQSHQSAATTKAAKEAQVLRSKGHHTAPFNFHAAASHLLANCQIRKICMVKN
jgi:transketolase N-terminal domain/subunit